jgi:mRNA interferase MazF
MCYKSIKRGDIYKCDLSPTIGSEQSGLRPVLIVQNNLGNANCRTTIIAAITSKTDKLLIPTHIFINKTESGLNQDSLVLLEQIRTIDVERLDGFCGSLSESAMKMVNKALAISIGLENYDGGKTHG